MKTIVIFFQISCKFVTSIVILFKLVNRIKVIYCFKFYVFIIHNITSCHYHQFINKIEMKFCLIPYRTTVIMTSLMKTQACFSQHSNQMD